MVRFGVFGAILLVTFWDCSMGQDELSSFEICSTNASQTLLVDDTESATMLAKAVNCSGGSFNAIWSGSVVVEHTIIIPEGTSLNVTGEGSGAEINGGGKIRVFKAEGATLHLANLTLRNGSAAYGGAMYAISSTVSWDGNMSFVNNMAGNHGGALYLLNSTVSWDGETSFTANEAMSGGGALYGTIGCTISVEGDTNFINNVASEDGGAVCVPFDDDNVDTSYFTFESNSNVLFLGNVCGGNGGAIAFIGEVDAQFSYNMMFLENSAGVAGGAIYLSGVTEGIHFEGSKFISNSAMTGGALSLVGTSSLIECEFIENSAYENEGPAISNNGIITDFSNCSFVENVFNCEAGNYLDFDDTDAQLDDSCTGCSTIDCTNCKFEGKQPTECVEALEHTNATGTDSTLESLLIDLGYWRATNTSVNILECYNSKACLGGLTGEDGYCLEGYEGPYCSVCSEGYTSSLGFTCNKCDDNAAGGIALVVILTVLVVFIFAALVSYMVSGKIGGADQGIVGRLTRLIPLQSVKIVIVVWQILTQFSTVANVVFPDVYQTFLDGVDILNFDLSWVLSIGCIIDTDFHDQLLLATLGPLACMVILGGTYIAAIRRNRSSEEDCGKVRQKHVSMLLLLTFLIYSSVSSTLFKTFACDELDDGKTYLRADYRIECDSSKHNALEIYAGFMVILYVVGIPALYGFLLYTNRKALMNNMSREEDKSIKPITDLWKPYRPERYFYEVVECVRRVLLTGALVFIYPNTAGQIAVALMIATFFIFVSEGLAPHLSPWDSWINRTGHAIVYSSMFLALLLKVDVTGEHASSQKAFESVLVAAHSGLILVVVIQAVAMVMTLRKEVKEYPIPRMRRGYSQGIGKGGGYLEDEAPSSFEDEIENEKSQPNQVMGQSQTAASKDIDISLGGGQC